MAQKSSNATFNYEEFIASDKVNMFYIKRLKEAGNSEISKAFSSF